MTENTLDAKTTPKRLILSLLSSPGFKEVTVIYLIEWGKIFNIDPPTTRVAVGRLAKQGFITPVSRGKYTIGPNAESVAKTARSWIDAEDHVGSWSGKWIVAHIAHLGRTNKTAVRSRERSFRLNGFTSAVAGLWCRPANLRDSLLQTKERLTLMGLEPQAVLMHCDAFSGIQLDELYQLWPTKQIESDYHQVIQNMRDSVARLQGMDIDGAVRETFTVGESVIRHINADPLLPDEMINTKLRREVLSQMKDYNELGRVVWERFHSELRS